jgi:ribosomal protein L7/L12
MSSNDSDIYDRLHALELLVKHLYKQTGVPIPDLAALATTEVSDHVRQLVAAGNKMGAMKAYREETGVDLRTANQVIESLNGG